MKRSFLTLNIHDAYAVGDRFIVMYHAAVAADIGQNAVTVNELIQLQLAEKES
jgi:hypothetical protein